MATIKLLLYTYKKYLDGTSPIMLRITKNSQLKYFKIGDKQFNILTKQWDEEYCQFKKDKRLNPDHDKLNSYLNKKKVEAEKIIAGFEDHKIPWTLFMFEEKFISKAGNVNFMEFLEIRIKELKAKDRFGSARNSEGTLDILKKFKSNLSKLQFPDIDLKFMEDLEFFLKNKGYKNSSIGIIMRDIRGTLNEAINRGIGCKESYPFSCIYGAHKAYKISKLETKSRKRFISNAFLKKMYDTNFDEPHLNWAKNLFLFSFFSSGINFKDMAFLKASNIKSRLDKNDVAREYIEFLRSKTHERIEVPVTTQVKELLNWFKTNYPRKKNFLLPIITNFNLKGEELNYHIISRRKRFNMHLKTIATNLEFPDAIQDITSYFARHSYATSLLRNGISVEKISQALGHSDIKTTQTYLAGFDEDEIALANEMLLK